MLAIMPKKEKHLDQVYVMPDEKLLHVIIEKGFF